METLNPDNVLNILKNAYYHSKIKETELNIPKKNTRETLLKEPFFSLESISPLFSS